MGFYTNVTMFRVSILLCFLHFLALSPYLANAITPEQKAMIHEQYEMVAINCIKENAITEDDIVKMRARQVPTGPNAPCFMACIMKHVAVMDDKGLIQKETALELAKTVFDEDELKNVEDYLHSCSHVNTEPVSDGEKGCDRAMFAFKCMIDNASQFGFDW